MYMYVKFQHTCSKQFVHLIICNSQIKQFSVTTTGAISNQIANVQAIQSYHIWFNLAINVNPGMPTRKDLYINICMWVVSQLKELVLSVTSTGNADSVINALYKHNHIVIKVRNIMLINPNHCHWIVSVCISWLCLGSLVGQKEE